VCVIVVELGKKKENKPSAARSWQQKKFTSAEELDTNSVIVVELGNEPFLFIEALWTAVRRGCEWKTEWESLWERDSEREMDGERETEWQGGGGEREWERKEGGEGGKEGVSAWERERDPERERVRETLREEWGERV
jgi:hypothetical protein